jgi:hypothetical protein
LDLLAAKEVLKIFIIFVKMYSSCCSADANIETSPVKVVFGDWMSMPAVVRVWLKEQIEMCQPDGLHIMDGSEEEDKTVIIIVYLFLTCIPILINIKFKPFFNLQIKKFACNLYSFIKKSLISSKLNYAKSANHSISK